MGELTAFPGARDQAADYSSIIKLKTACGGLGADDPDI